MGIISALDESSTGGHFNPFAREHGRPDEGSREWSRVGEIANLNPDETAPARFAALYEGLGNILGLKGRTIAVHARGMAGGRINLLMMQVRDWRLM